MENKGLVRLFQVTFFASIFGLWYGVTSTGYVSSIFLPELPVLARAFVKLIMSGDWISPLQVTLYEVGCAYAISITAGTFIGFLVSRSKFSTRVFEPLFSSIFAIPLIIFYPLAMLFFGLGVGSKIALGATVSFFPIVLNTISGFSNVNPVYTRAASSMGAPGFLLFKRVLLPAALPVILTGLRIGFVLCFLSIIGGETLGSLNGLGHKIVFHAESMNTAGMFTYIIFVIIIAFILNTLVLRLERKGAHYR